MVTKRSTASVLAALVGTLIIAGIGAGIVTACFIPWAIETYQGTKEVVALLGIFGLAFAGLWLFALAFVFGLSE